VTKHEEMQRIIRQYKHEKGKAEVQMAEVVKFAVGMGWKVPPPINPMDRLAKEFAVAAREEVRHDKKTGRPYRANHAVKTMQGGVQLVFWVDIDEAPRKPMVKSLNNRREQMVDDGLMLSYDADHWNSIHPDEEPIQLEMDLTPDIEWRKNSPDEQKVAV
jgi:hypothetical protein